MTIVKNLDPQNSTSVGEMLPFRGPVSSIPVPVTPMEMLGKALQAGAGIEILEKLMGLQERFQANQARMEFDQAIASAKAEIPVISKNRAVDFTSAKGRTNYKYEDLAGIARIVTPILAKFGLSYRFRVSSNVNEPITVTCIVSHRGGHFEEVTLAGGRDDTGGKNAIQQVGSTLTYLQRMTLKAALGLAAADDDDGNAAGMGETISEEQLMVLTTMVLEVGANLSAFCKLLKVEALVSLPARQFDSAVALLKSKRKAEPKTEEAKP